MKPRRLTTLALFSLLLTSALAAQQPAAPASPEPRVVPPEHASARATMRTFLEAFNPERRATDADPLAIAAACLDLSQIRESLRGHQGRELALQLKEILDKTELIDVLSLSDDPEAPPYTLAIDDTGEIVLAPDAAGEWRFTAATVRAIPGLLAALRDREVVEGVTRVEPMTPAMWLRAQMPPALRDMGLLMEHWQWLALLALLFVGLILDGLAAALLRTLVSGDWTTLPPARLKRALRPAGLFAAALFWWAGVYWLGLPAGVLEVLLVAVHFVVAFSFVWTAYRLVDVLGGMLEARAVETGNKFDDLLVPLVRKTLKVVITAFGLVFVADTLQLPIGGILTGVGLGGLAVALAAQDLVKNLFGSLLVIMDRPFSVGDYVEVGSVEGTVEELGFRSTRIRTPADSLVTLPNSHLITTAVDNLEVRRYRRWKTTLSLTCDTPPEKITAFCDGVRELIEAHPTTRKEGYQVAFNEFAASSLDVLLQVQFEVPGYAGEIAAKHSLGLDILHLAERLGVEMAFPTRTVHLQGAVPPTGRGS